MAVPVLGARKIMSSVKKALKKNKELKRYHHDWMIKGKTRDLYFTGKEYVGYQMQFDFDD